MKIKATLFVTLGLLAVALQVCEAHRGSGPSGHRRRPTHNHGNRPSGSSTTAQPSTTPSLAIDNRSLDEIYRAALTEGGKLIVYAGGDSPRTQNARKKAFEARFPGITLETIVDFSKVHDARIDMQVETGRIIPDVVQLQTLQDFERWKEEGILLPYKAPSWDKVLTTFKDPEGHWTAVYVNTFSNTVNLAVMGNDSSKWPYEPRDFLRPELKGKIVTTWPNDDDGVLFLFYKIIEKEGWTWLAKFKEQNPILVRTSLVPLEMVMNGTAGVALAAGASVRDIAYQTGTTRSYTPKQGAFVTWGQRAAILKATKRPNSAKLYIAWNLDAATQRTLALPGSWSVRSDLGRPEGTKDVTDYKPQMDIEEFPAFMRDRAEVERFKQQIRIYLGDPQGPSQELGPYPEKMVDGAYP